MNREEEIKRVVKFGIQLWHRYDTQWGTSGYGTFLEWLENIVVGELGAKGEEFFAMEFARTLGRNKVEYDWLTMRDFCLTCGFPIFGGSDYLKAMSLSKDEKTKDKVPKK